MDEITGQSFDSQVYQNQPIPSGGYEMNVNLNQPFLKSMTGWATFKGIMDIITGVFACFGFILIIPAVYGVYQIISGVKLLNAVDELKKFMATNDTNRINGTFFNMQKYFKFNGISMIIQIVFAILFIIAYIVFIVYIVTNGPDLFRNLPGFELPQY